MSLISISNLCFSYDGNSDVLFDNVSIMIDTDWKLGLVGRNGRGKTTLLNLLAGKLEYSGRINSSVSFDYFPFEVENRDRMGIEILYDLVPTLELWQLNKELNLLDMEEDCLYRKFSTLSGGEQTKILLSALFLKENNFLLIDEPTNNLDLMSRRIVSKYLDAKKGYILVSHDRNFIDGCVSHILSINRADIEIQRGNLSSWLANKEKRDAFERAENEKLQGEISRLRQSQKRSGDWSQKGYRESTSNSADEGLAGYKEFHRKKAGKLDSQVRQMEKRIARNIADKSKLLRNIERVDELRIDSLSHHSDRLLQVRDLTISYGEASVFSSLNFSVSQGERVAILGKNGSGKSSILKLILGDSIPHSGNIWMASGMKISYVSQETGYLKGSLSEYAEENELDETKFKTLLAKLDLSKEGFHRDISKLSSGQKKKVLIATSICTKAHLYIWDEALSYIDILSRIQIEKLLIDSNITLLFVEHDSYFIDKIATKKVEL